MPLQNRVDPFGDIHAVDARGMFTGNRGIIHDAATRTLLKRRWTTKAWIICTCEYKGIRREPMGRNGPNGKADHAIRGGKALRWSFSGYDRVTDFDQFGSGEMCVVTPAATIAVLGRGYRPVWHPSAEGLTG